AQPGNRELIPQQLRQALGEGLHQLEARLGGECLNALRHRRIVERMRQVVLRRRRADVPAHHQVQPQALANLAFPVVDTDDGIHFQAFDEHVVHALAPDTTRGCHPFRIEAHPPGMDTMFWLLAILAYLLGSLSFAILLSRLVGAPDPRANGSGNPGATNMLRVAGRRMAILTLLGDVLKALLPVVLAGLFGFSLQDQAWIGLAAVVGHLYPVFFHFRGGKGVATAAGMLLGLYPLAALLAAD